MHTEECELSRLATACYLISPKDCHSACGRSRSKPARVCGSADVSMHRIHSRARKIGRSDFLGYIQPRQRHRETRFIRGK